MGKALSYCYKCSTLLREDDFTRGKAVRVGDHVSCSACAPEAPASPPPPTPLRPARLSSSTAVPAVPRRSPPTTSVQIPPKSRLPWILGGVVAAVVLVALAIFALSDGGPRPVEPEAPKGPEVPAEIVASRKALDAARRFAREHPDDLSGQVREFTSVALQFDRTPEGKEASKEADRLKSATAERVMVAMAQLENSIKPLLDKSDFAGAINLLEAAEKKLALSEWEIAVKNRTAEVRQQAFRKPAPAAEVPDLVAYWTFEEGSGTVTKDVTANGRDGTLMGNAAWAEGRRGKGIRFDGANSWIDLKRDPLMDSLQTKSFTLALWFKPEGVPQGEGDQNNAAYGLLMKPGFHLGLAYSRWKRVYVNVWLAERTDVGITSGVDSPPDQFAHAACVVNRTAGTTELYVNGELQGTNRWKPDSPSFDYEGNPWRIGYAAPGAKVYSWPAKGVIDEPRMYSRALTADEVRRVYEVGR